MTKPDRPDFQEGDTVQRRGPLGVGMPVARGIVKRVFLAHGHWMIEVEFERGTECFVASEYRK